MSEFECRCGGIFTRNKEGSMCCPDCGSGRPYRMDGLTASEHRRREEHYDRMEAEKEVDEDEE